MYRLHGFFESPDKPTMLYYDEQYSVLRDYERNLLELVDHKGELRDIEKKDYSLRITLGMHCNSSCRYCNRDMKQKDIPYKGTDFVDRVVELTDKHIGRVELWGGEPLVYFRKMKDIVERFNYHFPPDGKQYLTYGFCTNGILLKNKDIQDWLLSLLTLSREERPKITFSISHDGLGQILRGVDILKDKDIVDFIKYLHSLYPNTVSFNPVISKYNFDMYQYKNYFDDILGFHPQYHEARPLMITNEESKALAMTDEQLEIFGTTNIKGLFLGDLDNWLIPDTYVDKFYGRMLKALKAYKTGTPDDSYKPMCMVGNKRTLVIDTDGNILPCQTWSKDSVDQYGESLFCGNIFNIDTLDDIKDPPNTAFMNKYHGRCKECLVRHICGGGCPYTPVEYDADNCKYYFMHCRTFFVWLIYRITGIVVTDIEKV